MERIETPRPRAGRRRRARSTLVVLGLVLAAALGLVASGVGEDTDPARVTASAPSVPAGAVPVSVSVDLHRHGRPVPARFLGLSFEASSLPQIATYGARGNLVGLLRSLGPGMLRFGGISADTRIAWTDRSTPRPAWASSVLEAGDLRRLATLAARSDWRVLLTVGLAHYDPFAAAREVRAAKRALGRWLAGVEIGNEPDAYARHGLRSAPWNPQLYDAEVRAYLKVIRRLAKGVRLAAPGVSGSHSFIRWGRAVARSQRPALLTGHHYPLGCHQLPPPSITGLLSAQARRLAGVSLARYMSVSRGSRIPFRMDEANSVSCGGSHGISDAFASALWATDYISEAMAAGVSGINLQGNPANCLGYSPLCATSPGRLARGLLQAQPVWYALLLSRALIGDRPLPTSASSPLRPNLSVRALLAPDGSLQFVIVEADPPGSSPVSVSLRVGRRYPAARMLALRAPSPEATAGVTLGGRPVAGDGTWAPRSAPSSIPAVAGVLTVTIPPSSADLVTVAGPRGR
jgi:hypothetical protein